MKKKLKKTLRRRNYKPCRNKDCWIYKMEYRTTWDVKLPKIKVKFWPKDDGTHVAVSDTGTGRVLWCHSMPARVRIRYRGMSFRSESFTFFEFYSNSVITNPDVEILYLHHNSYTRNAGLFESRIISTLSGPCTCNESSIYCRDSSAQQKRQMSDALHTSIHKSDGHFSLHSTPTPHLDLSAMANNVVLTLNPEPSSSN